jgi:uncharacterized protein (TIGR00369 family)
MDTIGARLTRIAAGEAEITLPFRADLSQQDGYVHAGVIATILDSACGYAAFSLIPPGANMLTAEFKINLLRPAVGEDFVARGRVVKPGKTLTVSTGEVVARAGDTQRVVAIMTATLMTLLADGGPGHE